MTVRSLQSFAEDIGLVPRVISKQGVVRIARSTKHWNQSSKPSTANTFGASTDLTFDQWMLWLNCVGCYLDGRDDEAKMMQLLKLMENLF